ncbi:MAG: four helix bundle protein [Microscillaceae bacterium]|jgi:four helix bundle protein|nr:four helix bundle protein [Microscillaceae bacterium]
MEKGDNLIQNLSFEFALAIINFAEILEEKKKYVIAKQILKSGTSIGANVWEAQHPESKADFVHKLKIAAKEAQETEYWLLLCQKSPTYPKNVELLEKLKTIQKILSKIISTTKSKT